MTILDIFGNKADGKKLYEQAQALFGEGEINEGYKIMEQAAEVGKALAETAAKKNIKSVVFDRSGYLYHGRIQALADAARENGLEF